MIELSSDARAAVGQLLSAVSTQIREWFKKSPVERAADRIAKTHPHGGGLKRALPPSDRRAEFGRLINIEGATL